jgi:acetolactate synthase-1/2/3 large subunit
MDRLGITGVMTHGEKAAVYMADGYARASHKPGVCMAQTIGAANLAAGLRDPYLACSPVIAITGGPSPEHRHRHVYQEIDDFPLFEPLTRFNARIEMVERLPDLLAQAFRSATTPCPGPVHLEIAGHFGQAADGGDLSNPVLPLTTNVPPFRPPAESGHVDRAVRLLQEAERPILVAGGGVAISGAQREVVELAERLQIPVATSLNAKGTIKENHRLSVGVTGSYSRDCANQAVAEADLIFFVGSRTGSQVTNFWRIPKPTARVIQLDIMSEELGRHYANLVSLWGDAKTVLQQILDAASGQSRTREGWLKRVDQLVERWRNEVEPLRRSEAVPMRPERICRELEEALPSDAILVSETGHAGIWTGTHLELHHAGQTYLRAAGSLGWGLPAALGAKCACPGRPVVCFSGDGGFYYHISELETAVRYGINTVTIVNNNRSLSQETLLFAQAYGGQQLSGFKMWQFEPMNLARIAEAFGCYAERVEEPRQIGPSLERALASGRPAVLDVVSDIKALAPDPWS